MLLYRLLPTTAWALLVACGGSSEPPIDAANAQQAQAIALASATPCTTVNQCGMLVFRSPTASCDCGTYHPYSLIAPSAQAASAAAAQQNFLAGLARSYVTPVGICSCVGPRALTCDAVSGCQFAQ